MTPEQLQIQLADDFELVCFVDLADLREKHSAMFNLFKQQHRDKFSPNQRLVFYSSYRPEKEFLYHLQRAAKKVDISNWFIIIVTKDDIVAELTSVNTLLGDDDVIITNIIVDLQNTKKFNKLQTVFSQSICAYPFTKFDIRDDQTIAPCSKSAPLGVITNESIDSIFYGSNYKQLRKKLIQGEKPKECSVCWNHETHGTTSSRQISLVKLEKFLDFECIDTPKIKQLDLSPTSLCNFKCRICGPSSSTQIATEELKFTNSHDKQNAMRQLLIDSRDRPKKLLEQLRSYHWNDLEYLHLFGGEPLIWPGLNDLIDYFIDIKRAPNIRLIINTNCSSFPKNIDKLIQNFKTVDFMLSIDDVDDRFELQRGGSWQEVFNNILKYSSIKNPSVQIKFTPTVNIQNLLYLDKVVDLAKSVKLEIVWLYLENPSFLSIDRITQETKNRVFEKYKDHPVSELRYIAQRVMQTPPISDQDFLTHMKLLDDRRGQDFQSSHKEIYDAMSQ